MKKSILLLVASLSLFACSKDSGSNNSDEVIGTLHSDGYYEVSVAEAKMLIEDEDLSIVVIDVSPYWSVGHLPGALNLPLGSGALDSAIPTLELAKPHLVYCHSDAPARIGANKLLAAGAKTVYRLIGNYGAWVEAGYPIETE